MPKVETNPTMVAVDGAKPKKAKGSMSHMEVHPRLAGGVIVKHVPMGYDSEPKEHVFKKTEGARFHAHMAKHTGMGAVKGEGSKHENAEEIDTED